MIELLIPENKIYVERSRLHPSAKVELTSEIRGSLITPVVYFWMTGHEEGLFLNFTEVGASALPSKLDFKTEVFPAFEIEKSEKGEVSENTGSNLATLALFKQLRLLQFHLEWWKDGDFCFAIGEGHLSFRQKEVTSSWQITSSDEEDSKKLATFFAQLPKMKS